MMLPHKGHSIFNSLVFFFPLLCVPFFFDDTAWHTVFICLCFSLCIVVLLLNGFYTAYIHLCNRLTVERLYIKNTVFCKPLYLYKFKGLCL